MFLYKIMYGVTFTAVDRYQNSIQRYFGRRKGDCKLGVMKKCVIIELYHIFSEDCNKVEKKKVFADSALAWILENIDNLNIENSITACVLTNILYYTRDKEQKEKLYNALVSKLLINMATLEIKHRTIMTIFIDIFKVSKTDKKEELANRLAQKIENNIALFATNMTKGEPTVLSMINCVLDNSSKEVSIRLRDSLKLYRSSSHTKTILDGDAGYEADSESDSGTVHSETEDSGSFARRFVRTKQRRFVRTKQERIIEKSIWFGLWLILLLQDNLIYLDTVIKGFAF